ncbi:MAG: CocE/NonD family hydrolase, partial [Chloroflexi bacterium]|nr:CocE/NonD family hydrolase [Chloroflexota bacterium]
MTVLVMLLILVMFGIFLFLYRRALIARMLGMPPPLNAVNVQRDIPVSMPDGVRLPTDHYAPKMPGDYPTLLIRTPYGRGKELALFGGYALSEMPAQRFAERGFNVIVQGCRGCLESEGAFSAHGNEAADGKATVAWIEQQPWFNGVLGTWGPSYLGYTQWATAASAPPSLKAMLPAVTSSENFTVSHPDGAFGLETRLRWSQGIFGLNKTHDLPLVETIRQRYLGGAEKRLQSAFNHLPLLEADTTAVGEPIPLYRDILMQNRVDDPYWTVRDHSRTAMKAVAEREVAVHFVGGWYDYYLRGLLRDYHSLIGAGCRPYLTIGPWYHGDPKGLMAGVKEGITWFDAQLHSNPNALREKAVNIFVMGAEEWREMEVFPPPSSETPYYLHPDAELSTEHPPAGTEPDHYRYDPGDPTPAVGGALLALKGAGPVDNRQLELRADVLCF